MTRAVRHPLPGVTYGPNWTPPRAEQRKRRRAPKALRYLPSTDLAEIMAAVRRYRTARLAHAWHPAARTLLRALPTRARALAEHDAVVAAALTDRHVLDAGMLLFVEDDRGRLSVACRVPWCAWAEPSCSCSRRAS